MKRKPVPAVDLTQKVKAQDPTVRALEVYAKTGDAEKAMRAFRANGGVAAS